MNRRMVFYVTGQIVLLEAILMALPAVVALIYGENCFWSILATIAVAVLLGLGLTLLRRPKNQTIYAKEGFVIVALSWVLLAAVGALPFWFSREIPCYVDGFFEMASGFTTTGASILTDVESMSRGLLFWRSFTHWIGGMGVLVLMMALLPSGSGRSIHMMRAEVPGPIVGKLVPRIRDTAKILYLIYLVMTLIEVACLLLADMPLFDSLIHAFGTAGTGGFGIKATSLGGYNTACQWIITVFMLLFGVNFNLYYLLLIRSFRPVFTSRELWVYVAVAAVATALITGNILSMYDGFGEALRHAAFQVSSILTTTGYATTDFDLWPTFSKTILLLLMFIGGCAGSTAGGLKVSRLLLLGKTVTRDLRRLVHPRSVGTIKLEGKRVEDPVVRSAGAYLVLYFALFAATFLVISLDAFDMETNLSAVAACINNVGPGFALVGPAASYAAFSPLSKLVLSFAMLLGRLELYPLLIAFLPRTWMKD
ncbi:MAG: TrkH family potassium uptake protein [Clostridia bacterium]|nr:TrkH family potassium uptake protein [Clostridia bacterium]